MVRNIAIISGNSHPEFVDNLCTALGVAPLKRILTKFSSGETRCEIQDSIRGKDVYIIQSFGVGTGGDRVNDYFMELCIMISACQMGSAQRVTVVMPLFPYSRQPDLPYAKAGAPRSAKPAPETGSSDSGRPDYTFESVPATPGPHIPQSAGFSGGVDILEKLCHASPPREGNEIRTFSKHDEKQNSIASVGSSMGYKLWMAQAGSLVADLLTCSGANRILTCDLHESTYQGFFNIPVDNLYCRRRLIDYIQHHIPNYRDAVIVSPDAGGAKRATAIADALDLPFALIHKERRPVAAAAKPHTTTPAAAATMILVGDVAGRTCLLVDDLADTANTITRAAQLLKRRHGAAAVVALLTHGVLSGDAVARINASALDRVVVTNSVPQGEARRAACPKLEVLDVSGMFAEAIRRVHHGESISVLF